MFERAAVVDATGPFDIFRDALVQALRTPLRERYADDGDFEGAVLHDGVKRGEDHLMGEIPGGAEDHQGVGHGGGHQAAVPMNTFAAARPSGKIRARCIVMPIVPFRGPLDRGVRWPGRRLMYENTPGVRLLDSTKPVRQLFRGRVIVRVVKAHRPSLFEKRRSIDEGGNRQ